SPKIEVALGYRRRARYRETNARALHAHVFDLRHALDDSQIDREGVVRGLPGAEFAAARKRPPLDALEQLFDVESRDRALAAGEAPPGRSIPCSRRERRDRRRER